jgi:SulP family sulfate permease
VLADAFSALLHAETWSPGSLAFALVSAAVVVLGRRLHPLFPGVLIAVAGSVVVSAIVDYGGNRVGSLDAGLLPPFGLSFRWSAVPDLAVGAFAIALIGFAEPASIARTFAAADRQPWNANKELFSQGAANVASAVSGGFPVGGSFSRSALSRLAGADGPWAGAVTGFAVLAALPLLPLLAPLPSAVLGAVVIVGVVGLIRVRSLIELISESLVQGLVALGTLAATLAFAPRVERGVLVGVGLAIAAHLYREVTNVGVDTALRGSLLRVRPTGVVWFVTAPEVERRIELCVADHPEVDQLTLDLGGVGRLDYTGAAILSRLAQNMTEAGLTVRVVRIPAAAARSVKVHLDDYVDRSVHDR